MHPNIAARYLDGVKNGLEKDMSLLEDALYSIMYYLESLEMYSSSSAKKKALKDTILFISEEGEG